MGGSNQDTKPHRVHLQNLRPGFLLVQDVQMYTIVPHAQRTTLDLKASSCLFIYLPLIVDWVGLDVNNNFCPPAF